MCQSPLSSLRVQLVGLPFGFIFQRSLDAAEAVEVFHLDDRRRDEAAIGLRHVDVDVGVAAQAAFLHLAIGDADLAQEQPQFFEIRFRLLRGVEIGLGDDFQQGRAGAIEIDEGIGPASRAP